MSNSDETPEFVQVRDSAGTYRADLIALQEVILKIDGVELSLSDVARYAAHKYLEVISGKPQVHRPSHRAPR